MRSPFALFRKHQKVMTVVLTGLAMFAFVILGAVNDPSNMPPALVVVVIACVFGGIGWVAGIRKKKSSEYGLVGIVIGTVLGVGASMASGPPVKVKADTGDLNIQQFQFLQYQQSRANEFIARAVQTVREKSQGQMPLQPPRFGFHADPEKNIVIGELLRHEAGELGIVVSDAMVNDFIRSVSRGQLDSADVGAIQDAMGLSGSELYDFLRNELKAQLAYGYLYDWSTLSSGSADGATLPPESYWDFYQRLNVRQSVGIVPVAVRDFIDESAEPTDDELQELFAKYRDDFPNRTEDGKLEAGRPGFRQPRKVQMAYLEAAFDAVEKLVEPPTDEEIEAFYNEHYKTIPLDEAEEDATSGAGAETSDDSAGPALPGPSEEVPEELPQGEIDGADLPPAEGEEKPAPGESEEGALLLSPSATEFVAFLQDEGQSVAEPAETAANEAESDDTPAADADQPVEVDASEASPPEGGQDQSAAENGPPPPPLPEPAAPPEAPAVRELDDELSSEIRDQLLRERTGDKLDEVVEEAARFMRELELRRLDSPDDPNYLTDEQALEELQSYAEKHGLTYAKTPPLSAFELQTSEDYPIGQAVDQLFSDPYNPRPTTTVVQQAFNSEPREVFRAVSVVQPQTESRFVYWKIDDQPEYVPESLDDPGIREQVVATWRELQAREQAKARADELARMAEEADKPLSEFFGDQTVTGKPDGPAITVLHPPSFSWLSKADPRMSPNPWSTPPPEMTRLRSVPGQIGESFMETVFDDLNVGEAGVAYSIDKDYYYVVRVDSRTYGRAADRAAFRERFLREPVFAPYYASDYPKLAQSKLVSMQTDWADALLDKYHVKILEDEPEPRPEEESVPPPSRAPASYY